MSFDSVGGPYSGVQENAQTYDHARPVHRWATGDDWTLQQPLIRRLYLEEGKPLPEVMRIMETEQSFRATSVPHRRHRAVLMRAKLLTYLQNEDVQTKNYPMGLAKA